MFTTCNDMPEPTRALRSPASCRCYSETWKVLAKAVPALGVVLLVVAGLAAQSIRSSAAARIRHDAQALAASDARDLEQLDSDMRHGMIALKTFPARSGVSGGHGILCLTWL